MVGGGQDRVINQGRPASFRGTFTSWTTPQDTIVTGIPQMTGRQKKDLPSDRSIG